MKRRYRTEVLYYCQQKGTDLNEAVAFVFAASLVHDVRLLERDKSDAFVISVMRKTRMILITQVTVTTGILNGVLQCGNIEQLD